MDRWRVILFPHGWATSAAGIRLSVEHTDYINLVLVLNATWNQSVIRNSELFYLNSEQTIHTVATLQLHTCSSKLYAVIKVSNTSLIISCQSVRSAWFNIYIHIYHIWYISKYISCIFLWGTAVLLRKGTKLVQSELVPDIIEHVQLHLVKIPCW